MRIKNFIKSTVALSLLAVSSVAFAQQKMSKKTPEERAQKQYSWMQSNLVLTDAQGKKVYDILLHYAQEADKMMNTPPGPEKKGERRDITNGKDAELKAVLTGDQYQQYGLHVEQMKEKMQQQRGNAAPAQEGGY